MPSVALRPDPIAPFLNRVPEITLLFWIIKILATTVGETAADFLNFRLHFGLGGTSWVMSALLALVLAAQFRAPPCPVALLARGGPDQRGWHVDLR